MKPPSLRIVTIPDANTAFGVAARLSMTQPAFARRPFGEWARVLEGQARRGHQVFVLNGENRAVGYFGYALAMEDVAEGWASGARNPTHEDLVEGDCLIWNAWIAEDRHVLRFMWQAFRRLAHDKKAVFFKRYYPDGRVRSGRLSITDAVAGHIRRQADTKDASEDREGDIA